jgi:hypothetical protein
VVHKRRIVKRTGDGVFVEFSGVVDAVRCAIEVQNARIERNTGLPRCAALSNLQHVEDLPSTEAVNPYPVVVRGRRTVRVSSITVAAHSMSTVPWDVRVWQW